MSVFVIMLYGCKKTYTLPSSGEDEEVSEKTVLLQEISELVTDGKDEARKTTEAQVAATEDEDGRAETIRKRAMEGLSKGCCFILKTHLLTVIKIYPFS